MKVFYTMDLSRLEYDCKECGGICCNINGYLKFTREQLKCNELFPEISDYVYKNEKNGYYCKTPKKCWFLYEDKCVLTDYKTKPYACSLYPVKPWKFNDEIIIASVIPCKSMRYISKKSKKFINVEKMISMSNTEDEIGKGFFDENILFTKSRGDREFYEYIKLIQKFIKFPGIKTQDSRQQILFDLFLQVAVEPILYNIINEINLPDIYDKYIYVLETQFRNSKTRNLQNLYILIHTCISKYILFNYYVPVSKDNKILYSEDKEITLEKNTVDYQYLSGLYNKSEIVWKIKA